MTKKLSIKEEVKSLINDGKTIKEVQELLPTVKKTTINWYFNKIKKDAAN